MDWRLQYTYAFVKSERIEDVGFIAVTALLTVKNYILIDMRRNVFAFRFVPVNTFLPPQLHKPDEIATNQVCYPFEQH